MTRFLIAAILSGALFFWLFWRPASAGGETSVKESVGKKTSLYARTLWIIIVTVVLTVLALALFENFYFHIGYLTEEVAFRAVVLGAVFGVVFAYWLTSVLLLQGNDEARKRGLSGHDAILWISMIVILLVGNEATFLKLAKLGANLKLPGGAELAIGRTEGSSRDTSLAVIVPPPGGSAANLKSAPDVSSGLAMLSGLSDAARRDALYFALISGLIQNGPAAASKTSELEKQLEEFQQTVQILDVYAKSLAKCFHAYAQLYEDDAVTAAALLPLGYKLRTSLGVFSNEIIPEASDLSVELGKFSEDTKYIRTHSRECEEWNNASNPKDIAKLADYMRREGPRNRPYLWSAASAIFAYNHQYTAAIGLLHQWLMNVQSHKNELDDNLWRVFHLRIRGQIASYMEEWISYRPLARTPAVLAYHQKNLSEAIELLEGMLKETKSSADDCDSLNINRQWSKPVIEKIKPFGRGGRDDLPVGKIEMSLYVTLLSLKRTWIEALADDQFLKAQSADTKRAQAQKYASDLISFDTTCLRLVRENKKDAGGVHGKSYAGLVRAQNIDAFARVERVLAMSSLPEEKTQRLKKALQLIELGLSLVAPKADEESKQREMSERPTMKYTDYISGEETIEAATRLRDAKNRFEQDLTM
jgi:hypothetical protein